MGSSGYNHNPFPYFPTHSSASYSLPLSLPSLLSCDPSSNNTTTTFNFHQPPHQDPASFLAPYFPIGHFSTSTTKEAAVINFAVSGNNVPSALEAGTGKKDRHSKIYTAQGLRDRRVRLSIDIARKFFDLQDMLGYDKASKTLEWLFSKSNKAINELSRTKYENFRVHGGVKTMNCLGSEEEKEELTWGLNIDEEYKEEEEKVSNKVESRAKARARARERTMEKKHHTNLSMEESSFMNKTKISAKKFIDEDGIKPRRDDEAEISQWKLLQEPSMMKRKWMPSIISDSSQRNFLISIDGIPINLTQNWDGNSNPTYPFAN